MDSNQVQQLEVFFPKIKFRGRIGSTILRLHIKLFHFDMNIFDFFARQDY